MLVAGSVTGTVDLTYDPDWILDRRPGYPVRRTTGDLSLAMTFAGSPAADADVFCIHHHAIQHGATITLTGDVSTTIPTATWPADRIPRNWYRRLDPAVPVDALTLTVTGNSGPDIIGGFIAGESYLFADDLLINRLYDPNKPFPWEGEFGLIRVYPTGVARPRRLSGSMIMGDADYAALVEWDLAASADGDASLIIPSDSVNDAWLAQFQFTETFDTAWHYITIEIVEIPRLRLI
jgi:hypothetical protein